MITTGQSISPRNLGAKSMTEVVIHGQRDDTAFTKINSVDNLGEPFTKPLTTKVFERYVNEMGMKCNPEWH